MRRGRKKRVKSVTKTSEVENEESSSFPSEVTIDDVDEAMKMMHGEEEKVVASTSVEVEVEIPDTVTENPNSEVANLSPIETKDESDEEHGEKTSGYYSEEDEVSQDLNQSDLVNMVIFGDTTPISNYKIIFERNESDDDCDVENIEKMDVSEIVVSESQVDTDNEDSVHETEIKISSISLEDKKTDITELTSEKTELESQESKPNIQTIEIGTLDDSTQSLIISESPEVTSEEPVLEKLPVLQEPVPSCSFASDIRTSEDVAKTRASNVDAVISEVIATFSGVDLKSTNYEIKVKEKFVKSPESKLKPVGEVKEKKRGRPRKIKDADIVIKPKTKAELKEFAPKLKKTFQDDEEEDSTKKPSRRSKLSKEEKAKLKSEKIKKSKSLKMESEADDSPTSPVSDNLTKPDLKVYPAKKLIKVDVPFKSPEVKPNDVRRRSNRIKKNRWEDATPVQEPNLPPPPPPVQVSSPVSTLFEPDKPVKVKSRWRRTSELEMGAHQTEPDQNFGTRSPIEKEGGFKKKHLKYLQDLKVSTELEENKEIDPEPAPQLLTVHPEIEERLKTFENITSNIFLTSRTTSKDTKRMLCDCTLTKEEIAKGEQGCGDDCLNRLLMIECGPRCCLGNLCSNKHFQNCQYTKCVVVKTERKGLGLVCSADIPGNHFIMEYVGEVLDAKEFRRRATEYSKEKTLHFYFMALKADSVIDATSKGNISRFINHSCDPNAETQKWTVNGELRIGFFSKRPICKGEEITFDYKMERYGKEAQKCFCNSANCTGWLGEEPDKDDDLDDDEDDDIEGDIDGDGDDEGQDECEDEIEEKDEKSEEKEDEKVLEIELDVKVDKDVKIVKQVKKIRKLKYERRKVSGEIEKLVATGIKNQAHTLNFNRIMVRTEDTESKIQLLKLAQRTDQRCLRLFLDYQGLSLLWSWMRDNNLSVGLKLELLDTLSLLPITNRTTLKDSRVLNIVEKWAHIKPAEPEKAEKIGTDSIENSPEVEEEPVDTGDPKEKENADKAIEKANALLEAWALLKEEFRIPKKERIEQMKEHEREANRGYVDENQSYDSVVAYRYSLAAPETTKQRKKVDEHEARRKAERNENANLIPKVQRRELFEQKAELEEQQRKETREMWQKHIEQCRAHGLDPLQTPMYCKVNGEHLYYHPKNDTYEKIPAHLIDGMHHPYPPSFHPLNMGIPPSPGGPMGHLIRPGMRMCPPNLLQKPGIMPMHFATPPPPFQPPPQFSQPPPPIQQFNFTQSHVFPQFRGQSPVLVNQSIPQTHSYPTIKPVTSPVVPLKVPPPKTCACTKNQKLPVNWVQVNLKNNVRYFYHEQLHVPQWHFPTSDEVINAEAEWLLRQQLPQMSESEDSESDSDEDDSSSEEEEETKPDEEEEEEKDEIPTKTDLPTTSEDSPLPSEENESLKQNLLCQFNIISPRDDEENYRKGVRKSKIRENREKVARLKMKRLKKVKMEQKDDAFSSGPGKRIKEKFMAEMANEIVHLLNPYRKPDCKIGRIQNNEDFKYLAKKLNLFVMVKELKHLKNVSELQCNEKVKHKAKDFVRKYMSKFGETYTRDE